MLVFFPSDERNAMRALLDASPFKEGSDRMSSRPIDAYSSLCTLVSDIVFTSQNEEAARRRLLTS